MPALWRTLKYPNVFVPNHFRDLEKELISHRDHRSLTGSYDLSYKGLLLTNARLLRLLSSPQYYFDSENAVG